jgi:hypothetical protein
VGIKIKCEVASCQQIISFTGFVKHLKGHIAAGTKIKCPAVGCGREITTRSTFAAHLSYEYGTLNKMNVSRQLLVNGAADVVSDSGEVEFLILE